eukprot:73655_1
MRILHLIIQWTPELAFIHDLQDISWCIGFLLAIIRQKQNSPEAASASNPPILSLTPSFFIVCSLTVVHGPDGDALICILISFVSFGAPRPDTRNSVINRFCLVSNKIQSNDSLYSSYLSSSGSESSSSSS